jgi:hypothetical protein
MNVALEGRVGEATRVYSSRAIGALDLCGGKHKTSRTCAVEVVVLLLGLGTSLTSAAQAPEDWKVRGISGENAVLFVSAADVRKLADGHLEVWTRGLAGKDVDSEGTRVLKEKDRTRRVVIGAMASGSPISELENIIPMYSLTCRSAYSRAP